MNDYDTTEEPLDNAMTAAYPEETNGWVVVLTLTDMLSKKTYNNVIGPFPKGEDSKRFARNCAARVRAKYKREYPEISGVILDRVSVKPLWKENNI